MERLRTFITRNAHYGFCCFWGEVLFTWGDELADSGHDGQAALRYHDALVYRAADAELHASLGMVLARLGRVGEARSEVEAALRIDPNLAPAKKALAQLR